MSTTNSQYRASLWERLLCDHASLYHRCTPTVIFDPVFLCRSVKCFNLYFYISLESIIPYGVYFSVFYLLGLHHQFLSVVWNFDSFTFWASKANIPILDTLSEPAVRWGVNILQVLNSQCGQELGVGAGG